MWKFESGDVGKLIVSHVSEIIYTSYEIIAVERGIHNDKLVVEITYQHPHMPPNKWVAYASVQGKVQQTGSVDLKLDVPERIMMRGRG